MARTLASAWVSVSPSGFADFAKTARDGIRKALTGIDPTVPIGADTKPAVASVDSLKIKLDELSRKVVAARVGVDSKAADATLAAMGVKLTELGARVARPGITVEGVARAEADILAVDASLDRLNDKTAKPSVSLGGKVAGGLAGASPLVAGGLLAIPAAATITGAALGATVGLTGALLAGAGALAAFGAVAKPVLSGALTAEQAVSAAQNMYNATIAAGVPTAQAQATLQAANARAQLTYNAALKGGANPAKALAAYHATLAQNQAAYNAATSTGTFTAKAYAAEQLAIGKAYAGLSPAQVALSKQLGAMATAWQGVKASLTPVVSLAITPWLKGITDGMAAITPIVDAVSPAIAALGLAFDNLVTSPAFQNFTAWIASIGSSAVSAVGTVLIDFFHALIILLPDFTPLIAGAVTWLAKLGPAVLAWASSKKTADDITAFMAWFKQNGPAVGGLLKYIGDALKTLAPGLAAGGQLEIKVLSDFLGYVAKLPKGIAGPLAEVAGAALVLAKLPGGTKVISFAVNLVGKGLTALLGLIGLGGQTATLSVASGGMQKAADTMVAAAGEMNAAARTMAGTSVAGGAAGGAEGSAAKGAAGGGAFAAAGAVAGLAFVGAFIGAAIRALGDFLSPAGSFAGNLNNMFQKLQINALQSFTFGGLEGFLTAHVGEPVGKVENDILAGAKLWGTNIAETFTKTWSNIAAGAVIAWDGIAKEVSGIWAGILAGAKLWGGNLVTAIAGTWSGILAGAKLWGGNIVTTIAGTWNAVKSGAATAWAGIWSAITSAVSSGVAAVVTFFRGLPGKIVTALGTLGGDLQAVAAQAMALLLAGAKSAVGGITSFFSSFASGIVSIFKKIWGWFSPSSVMYEGGKALMEGLAGGIKDHAAKAVAQAQAAATSVAGAGKGPASAGAAAAQAYARSRLSAYGWGSGQMAPLISLWNEESGWNRLASNPASGAYGIPQALPGSKMGPLANPPTSSAGAQIDWGLGYIKSTYGTPAAAYAFENSHTPHWYGAGLADAMFTRPTLIGVGERGPERVTVTPGGQPAAADQGAAIVAELRALRAAVDNLNATTAAGPARTGAHVADAVNAGASAAVFRARYPR